MNTFQLPAIALMMWTLNIQVIDKAIGSPKFDALTHLASASPSPDKIIAAKTASGYFTNFIWGDYFYAFIQTSREKMIFLIDRDEDCFLAHHRRVKLSIRYDLVQRYTPEAGGYRSVSIIRDIRTPSTDLAKWRRSMTPVKLKQCPQLIEKATKPSR